MPAKLQQFRTEDAKLVPAGYVDGPDGHRLPVGDALYVVWVLMNLRTLCNARYGVSEVAHALGSCRNRQQREQGDEEESETADHDDYPQKGEIAPKKRDSQPSRLARWTEPAPE